MLSYMMHRDTSDSGPPVMPWRAPPCLVMEGDKLSFRRQAETSGDTL